MRESRELKGKKKLKRGGGGCNQEGGGGLNVSLQAALLEHTPFVIPVPAALNRVVEQHPVLLLVCCCTLLMLLPFVAVIRFVTSAT